MAKANKGHPIHFIASHCQSSDDKGVKSFFVKIKADDNEYNLSVRQQARHSGITSNGLPAYAIFDHKGKLQFQGRVGNLDAMITKLLANVPYVDIDVDQFKAMADAAKLVVKKETMVQGYLKAVKAVKKKSSSEEAITESKKIIEVVESHVEKTFERLLNNLPKYPISAMDEIEAAMKVYKKFTIVSGIKEKLKTLKADKDFKTQLKIAKEFKANKEKIDKKNNIKNKDALKVLKKLIKYVEEYPDFYISKRASAYIAKFKS